MNEYSILNQPAHIQIRFISKPAHRPTNLSAAAQEEACFTRIFFVYFHYCCCRLRLQAIKFRMPQIGFALKDSEVYQRYVAGTPDDNGNTNGRRWSNLDPFERDVGDG